MAYFKTLAFIADTEPHCAAVNMAMDEVILEEISVPTLRAYRWRKPAVSFGYFEKYFTMAQEHGGREPVRRWTGGGVVLHGEDFTYSLLVPVGDAFLEMKPAESYRAIHEALAETMRDAGVEARVAATAAPKISQACFENAVQHDVVAGGRKVAGAAQRRTKKGLLHQGSVLVDGLPNEFGERLAQRLAAAVVQQEIEQRWLEVANTLADAKYGTEEWLRKF